MQDICNGLVVLVLIFGYLYTTYDLESKIRTLQEEVGSLKNQAANTPSYPEDFSKIAKASAERALQAAQEATRILNRDKEQQ